MFFDRYLSFIIICCSLFLWFVDWFRYVCGEDDDKKETTKVTKKCVLLNACQLKITSLLVFFFFSFSRLLLLCVGSFKELPKINTAHRRFRNMPFGVWAKKNWREKQKHLLKTDFLYISMFFFLTPLIVNRSTRGVLIVTLLVVFFMSSSFCWNRRFSLAFVLTQNQKYPQSIDFIYCVSMLNT